MNWVLFSRIITLQNLLISNIQQYFTFRPIYQVRYHNKTTLGCKIITDYIRLVEGPYLLLLNYIKNVQSNNKY